MILHNDPPVPCEAEHPTKNPQQKLSAVDGLTTMSNSACLKQNRIHRPTIRAKYLKRYDFGQRKSFDFCDEADPDWSVQISDLVLQIEGKSLNLGGTIAKKLIWTAWYKLRFWWNRSNRIIQFKWYNCDETDLDWSVQISLLMVRIEWKSFDLGGTIATESIRSDRCRLGVVTIKENYVEPLGTSMHTWKWKHFRSFGSYFVMQTT